MGTTDTTDLSEAAGRRGALRRTLAALERDEVRWRLLLLAAPIAVAAQLALSAGYVAAGAAGLVAAMLLAAAEARALPAAPVATSAAAAWLVSRRAWLAIPALAAGWAAYESSGGNRYRPENVLPWLAGVALWLLAWAELRRRDAGQPQAAEGERTGGRWRALAVAGALAAALALGAYFRLAELDTLPRDMVMDQAEKLLDVNDALTGKPYIFFERNTGREPWQFYWTAGLVRLFHMPVDFLTLKTGTALIGWLMLPGLFLLAREVFGTRAALLATLLGAVASWGVLGARYGLRYPLAPCATAWTMFFLVRGLRRDERNSMLMAGVWLGIGLQGYTAYRFMLPVFGLLVLAAAVWRLAQRRRALAWRAIVSGALAGVLGLLVMVPLVRYGVDNFDKLSYRANTRMTGLERPIQGSVPQIFLSNVGNVLLMFNYSTDNTWVVNIKGKPAADPVLGALVAVGAAATLALSVRRRDPWPALVLGAGALMLVPSALSIAFPRENPSLVRTGGAIPMIMAAAATVPAMLVEGAARRRALARALGTAAVAALAAAVVLLNYQRVFVEYRQTYCEAGQNASDVSRVVRASMDRGLSRDTIYVVGFNDWADYRAVYVGAGDLSYGNTIVGPKYIPNLYGRPGLFVASPHDTDTIAAILSKYPGAQLSVIPTTDCPDKDFVAIAVPGKDGRLP